MKVKELIEKLKEMPDDNDVWLYVEDDDYEFLERPLESIELGKLDKSLVILCWENK